MNLFDNFICMSNTAAKKCKVLGKENAQEKAKKRFHVKSAILGYIKNVLNSKEKILKFKFNSLCQRCLRKYVLFSKEQ